MEECLAKLSANSEKKKKKKKNLAHSDGSRFLSECHSCTSSVSVQFQTWPKRVPPAVTRIASMKYTGGEKYFVTEREKERETGRNI